MTTEPSFPSRKALVNRFNFQNWEVDDLLFSISTAEKSLELETQDGRLMVNFELKHLIELNPLIPSPFTSSILKTGNTKTLLLHARSPQA